LGIFVAGVMAVWAVIPIRQIMEQDRRLQAATVELAEVEAENQLLEDEVLALNTPAEIERLARERLGYVMPGDTPYVVVEPPEVTAESTSPEATVLSPREEPWYQNIWEFLTGADLVES
jgi:hypothetical protein